MKPNIDIVIDCVCPGVLLPTPDIVGAQNSIDEI